MKKNQRRAQYALDAVRAYLYARGRDTEPVEPEDLVDLATDLLHLAGQRSQNTDGLLRCAAAHYKEEV